MVVDASGTPSTASGWFLQGVKGIASAPALILVVAHVGFAGLARDADITWTQASFMVLTIWALPANIVLLGAVSAGLSLAATALAVTLSSIRLMPMVIALMPEIRGETTRSRTLFLLSHFVAVTGWVFAMQHVSKVPKQHRAIFFCGFATTLCVLNTLVVAIAFNLMGQLPALVIGALAFLTPIYFLMSLFDSARESSGRIGLFTGIAALPVANLVTPKLDILVAGLAGGSVAFLIGGYLDRRSAAN